MFARRALLQARRRGLAEMTRAPEGTANSSPKLLA